MLRKSVWLLVVLCVSLFGDKEYTGCGDTKQKALENLTGSIVSRIENSYEQSSSLSQKNGDTDVAKEIDFYLKASSNMTLRDIHYSSKEGKMCASVKQSEQQDYLRVLLQKSKTYTPQNLPKDLESKIQKLQNWMHDLDTLTQLIPVFLPETIEQTQALQKQQKELQDIYSNALARSKKLAFKGCAKERDDALVQLNEAIFNKEHKEKGLFSSVTSFFGKKDKKEQRIQQAVDFFVSKVRFIPEKTKVCAVIKKDDISNVAKRLYNDLMHFDAKMLPLKQKERYHELEALLKKTEITKLLMQPFGDIFTKVEFKKLAALKEKLQKLKQETHPQTVSFEIINGENTVLKIDGKIYKKYKNISLETGGHTYSIKAKERCPLQGSFELDFMEDETIDVDFDEYHYPTFLFISDKDAHIAVDGQKVTVNITTEVPKCEGEVLYIAKFAQQTQKEKVTLQPNKKYQYELFFLSPKELAIFNYVKTKYFKVKNNDTISESLTEIASENLHFEVDEDVKHGKLELDERGSFIYTPDETYAGKDRFSYHIEANGKQSPKKIVNIEVEPSVAQQVQQVSAKMADDLNKTATQTLQKAQHVAKEVKEEFDEQKYLRFRAYIQSLDPNKDMQKIQKLAKKYPQYFKKFLEDMKAGN